MEFFARPLRNCVVILRVTKRSPKRLNRFGDLASHPGGSSQIVVSLWKRRKYLHGRLKKRDCADRIFHYYCDVNSHRIMGHVMAGMFFEQRFDFRFHRAARAQFQPLQ